MRKISRAIVTGGAGFIGSHIVDELIKRGIETYVVDNLRTGSLENLRQHEHNKLFHMVFGDAKHMDRLLFNVNDIDVIFHEAAIASVPLSVSQPMLVHNVNVNMTLDVMNFCLDKNIKRFVFASSAAVYGVIKNNHASEDMICKRSEEHTSELQSQSNLVCRLLLEKKKKKDTEDSDYADQLVEGAHFLAHLTTVPVSIVSNYHLGAFTHDIDSIGCT